MVTLLIIAVGIVLLGGLVLGYLVRGEVDERTRQRLERARLKLTELQAERHIHAIATAAFNELLDAARHRSDR